MSIDRLTKFIQKYGQWVFGLMLVAFAVAFISTGNKCNGPGQNGGDLNKNEGPVVAHLGKVNATSLEIDQIANGETQSSGSIPSPDLLAQAYGSAIANVLDHVYGLALANSKGIAMDDQEVEEAIPSLWNQQLDTFRQQLTEAGKLPPNATQADFEKSFEANASMINQSFTPGMTLDQARQSYTDSFNAAFNEPSKRELIRSETATHELLEKYGALATPTDDEVKNSFGDYKVLRLAVLDKPGVKAQDVANQALAAIKGGMKFEDAINKYSNDKPMAGKSLTDPIDVGTFELQYMSIYRPLLDLKEGDVSNVLTMADGSYAVFKVVKFTPNVPPDFEAKKGQVITTMAQSAAQAQMGQDIQNLKKSGALQWNSAAYEAMNEYQDASVEGPEKKDADLKKAQQDGKAAIQSDALNSHVAALAYYIASKTLYDSAKGDDKKQYAPERIASMEALLQTQDDADTRMQLLELYVAAGRTSDAVDQLIDASKIIPGYSEQALGTYENILARYNKLDAAGSIPADKKKLIESGLQDWRNTMIEEQQTRLASIKAQEDLEKQNEAAMAKQAAEDAAKKKAAAAAATTPKTARTVGSTAFTPTTAGAMQAPASATAAPVQSKPAAASPAKPKGK